MYRIRLVSGQEQVYRSIQELTAGVQRGEVTGEAEIYHQRTERWLSIESHPHYKMAAEGGTATRTSTRTSRLKFTRPSSPAVAPAVLPTPAAQKPGQDDLEELNRLLVLLDPLPTPAQRAEPEPAAPPSPPELTLVRPTPAPPSSESADTEQNFGTMLRLEDLEPIPELSPAEADPIEVIRDERELVDESPPEPPPVDVEPAIAMVEDIAPSDLGLPVEIVLDEIPVPEPEVEAPIREEPAVAAVAAPVPVEKAAEPDWAARQPPIDDQRDVPAVARPARRFRPMLYVGAAAVLAAAVFALTGGNSNPEQGMVTPAFATPSPVNVAPSETPDSTPTSAPVATPATAGFPVPAAEPPKPGKATADNTVDSAPPAALLPSAPTIDLSANGTAQVDAGSAPSRSPTGSGSELARSYAGAYDALAADFVGQMDRSGLVRLFSQTQLTTADGAAGARTALDAATVSVRRYHAKESAIERAYQDSARALERSGATPTDMRDWITHLSRQESKEAADEGTRLLGQVDAVFALLQAQSGRYRMTGSEIRFDNADAAARYAELQGWITRRLEHWSGQPASSVPTTVQPILDGIGLTRLPISR